VSDAVSTGGHLDCDAAFALSEGATLGGRSSGLRVTPRGPLDNAFALVLGEERPAEPIEFVRSQGRIPYDLIGTTWAVVDLVSAKFRGVLEEHGFTGWTTFPVRIIVDDDQEALHGYEGLAVTGRCGALDDSLSERVTLPPPVVGGREAAGLRGLCFPPDSWDGSDVFTHEGRAGVCVVERVKDALEHAGVTNVKFSRLSEIERTWKADGSLLDPL
jgi:uncharacterized protein DUF1629